MSKLIILTPSIIRGDFHKKTIGKFYDYFFEFLKDYEIFHIINIDEPKNLKKYFNKYETMQIYNEIIPDKVNKIYINEPEPGFLNAYKKLIKKVEELNLINNNYLYYWLEDDWEPKTKYNINSMFKLFNFPNSAYTFTHNAPLGSFRGGPFMSGSYFKNVFNIKKYMNNTCDPERQMQRWIKGSNFSNGLKKIHRLSIQNKDIDNKNINLILVCLNSKIYISELCDWIYKSPSYNSSIKFQYHIITCNNDYKLQYSEVKDNKYSLEDIDEIYLKSLFNDLSIKYFIIKPNIMFDLGRIFNKNYGLKKWVNINDGTTYSTSNYYNVNLGNWKLYNEDNLRLKPNITMNKGFFSSIAYIHQCLPYLEKNYFDKGIKLNILYYSHNYGSYPNFQVIGKILQLNYLPSLNTSNKQYDELSCFRNLFRKLCGNQIRNEDTSLFQSFKDDFVLANKYFFKFFKFSDKIKNNVKLFCDQFKDKKILGIHFRGTDKNKVKWITHISIDEFINIIDNHLKSNQYNIIFISTDDFKFISKMKELYEKKYLILYYDKEKNNDNDNSIHLNRLRIIENKIKEIKENKNNINNLVLLENELKKETKYNEFLFENIVINSFILSKCNLVLKTHSQVSAYSKIFNPELEIYRVNSCLEGYWPDSHIPLYDYKNIDDVQVKNLLEKKLKNEFSLEKKFMYKNII